MPFRRCVAKTCFNTQNCRPNLKFFESPKDDLSYRKWAINCGRPDLLEQGRKFFLCADHFEDDCFLNPIYRTIFVRDGSIPVPSIFRNNFVDFVPGALQKSVNGLQEAANPIITSDEHVINDSRTLVTADNAERDTVDQESQKLCRLCATSIRESELISITQLTEDNESPLDRLARLMPDTVSADDGLPQFACPACLTKLELCDKTIVDFIAADTKLRSLFLSYDLPLAGTDVWDAFPNGPGDDLDTVDASTLAVALHSACPPEEHDLLNTCPPKNHDTCPPGIVSINDSCLLKHDLHNTCSLDAPHLGDTCQPKQDPLDNTTGSLAATAVAQHFADGVQLRKAALKCPLCHAGFPTETQLATHLRLHDGSTPHECPTCAMRFAFRAQLRKHLAMHEAEHLAMLAGFSEIASTNSQGASINLDSDSTSIPPINSPRLTGISNGLKIRNSIDRSSTTSESAFLSTVVNGMVCAECGSLFGSRAALRRHERTHRGRSCLCCRCGKVLANPASLKVHQRSHSAERRFLCDKCPKKFKDASSLVRHKSTHAQHKPFPCPCCDRSFATSPLLRQHSTVHASERSFRCLRCPASFGRRGNLAAHVAQCERRPHQCTTCGKRVRNELTLRYHESRHTGERLPFGCATCTRRFRSAGTLRTHLRVHSGERPYECGKCGQRFRSAGTLHQHSARHRDERPFGCALCERRFKRRPSLTVHLRTHTGERPYTCAICQRAFAQRGDLRKHQRTHRELVPTLEPFALGELGELLLLELPAVEVEVP